MNLHIHFLKLFGSSPSGYPISDYYFWLLFIVIPDSIIAAWSSRFTVKRMELFLNFMSRKFATLRFALLLKEYEADIAFRKEFDPWTTELDWAEKKVLENLKVSTKPKEFRKIFLSLQKFDVDFNQLVERKDTIMEYQRDTKAISPKNL